MKRLLTVSTVARASDIDPKSLELSWRGLAQKLSHVKPRGESSLLEYLNLPRLKRSAQKNGPGWIPGIFRKGGSRTDNDIQKLHCFVGDCDNNKTGVTITKDLLEEKLNGHEYVIHSTYSHSSQKPKWRFVVPYKHPILKTDHEKVFNHFNRLLSGGLDPKGKTPSQLYFWPSCPPDAVKQFEYLHGVGEVFDPDAISATTVPKTIQSKEKEIVLPKTLPEIDIKSFKLKRSTLDLILYGENSKKKFSSRSEAVFSATLALLSRNLTEPEIAAVLLNKEYKISEKIYEQKDPRNYVIRTLRKARAWRAVPDNATIDELITQMNLHHAVIMVGGRCVILTETEDPILGRKEIVLSVEHDLRLKYANRRITLNEKSTDLATLWLQHPERRQYERLIFSPQQDVPDCYNLWKGFSIEPVAGDCSLYLKHIEENVAQGNKKIFKYIMAFMADAVQNPSRLPGVALVMRGGEGVGKGTLATEFGKLFGQHFIQVSQARHLVGNFNAHLKDVLVVYADEAFWAGDKASEGALKAMITEEQRTLEHKGKDSVTISNFLRTIISSNHEWVVPAGPMARRFFVVDVGDKYQQDATYFSSIKKQMENGGRAALLHYLLNYDLEGIDIRQFPRTEALLEQQMMTLGIEEEFWVSCLRKGEQMSRSKEWKVYVSCQTLFDQYVQFAKDMGVTRRSSETRLGHFLYKVCDEIKRVRVQKGGSRSYAYKFPELKVCRKSYEKRINAPIDWKK